MPPLSVFNQNTKRETGAKAQSNNILAAKTVSDIIRTTLGPRSMLKMLLDANGGIVITNDGNAILREIDVSHPAAKSMIELSRTQDEEVGDGTTSVIILAGEMLHVAQPFLDQQIHPTQIVKAYAKALEDGLAAIDALSFSIDVNDDDAMYKVVSSCIGTKFTSRLGRLVPELALDAIRTVRVATTPTQVEIDFKKYAKVEKIPGGAVEDCRVLKGVMFQKDLVAPGRMRRSIPNPRVLLLDCPLEYKKGENQTNVEMSREEDFAALLKVEEDWIKGVCDVITGFKPDVVITEKGMSDLCAHYLTKAGVSAIRRLRKTDNNRIARACGATIVHRPEEIRESDIGTGAGLFEVSKIGDEYWTFIVDCAEPKACTVLLRGASKEILNEVERNLVDAMCVARNIAVDPRLVPGGGAVEMATSYALQQAAASMTAVPAGPYGAVAAALEVIPRTLAQNCGASVIRTITQLRAKHTEAGGGTWGINGETGKTVDMKELGVWEPYAVKVQTLKTAVESAVMLLRIDDIVSGLAKKSQGGGGGQKPMETTDGDNVDSEQMIPE